MTIIVSAYQRRIIRQGLSRVLLSIFRVRGDYGLNDAAREAMLLAPAEGEKRGEEQ